MAGTRNGSEIEALSVAFADGRERLMRAIAGVSEEQFKRRPAPTPADGAPWCIAEVLAHLLWSERLEAERIALALAQNAASISPAAPEEQAAAARAGRVAPVPQLVHGLLGTRRQLEALIARAATVDGALEHCVVHPIRGRDTVDWMLREKVIGHELEHAAQIEALRLAIGAPPVEAATR